MNVRIRTAYSSRKTKYVSRVGRGHPEVSKYNNTDTFSAAKYILGSDPGKENQC